MANQSLQGKSGIVSAFERLVDLMEKLRGPGGCPWDREQDLASLRTYLLEETYEVLDALDREDVDDHREELGDLLFQVVFQSQVRREAGQFTVEDVIEGIHDKLVRRHPHVFGGSSASTADEVLDQWERLKAKEKQGTSRPSILDHVPAQLPALLQALRLTEKAARVGFDWTAERDLMEKVEEEWRELRQEAESGSRDGFEAELGDMLFVLANVARRRGLDPEQALRRANRKFTRRFRHIEASLSAAGRRIEEASLDEMETLWNEAKALESDGGSGSG